jgi:anti-sigma regulatory factor (Ser/Thr protein kinase)
VRLPGQAPGPPRRLDLTLPAVHQYSRMGRRLVRSFARLDGMPDAEVETLALLASELLSNVVDHGGGEAALEPQESTGAVMRLQVWTELGAWRIAVSDQGGGDPAELQPFLEAEIEVALTDERGRGFFLIKQLSDHVEITASEDGAGLRISASKGRFSGE